MTRVVVVVAFVISLAVSATLAQVLTGNAPRAGAGAPAEMVEIDGTKNPELIPQWSAWGFAFRVIANGPGTLPKAVHEVVSKEEAALVVSEARAVQQIDRTCQQRVAGLHPLLGKESNSSLDAKLRAITVECRWGTLNARDRVLQALNPAGRLR